MFERYSSDLAPSKPAATPPRGGGLTLQQMVPAPCERGSLPKASEVAPTSSRGGLVLA